MKTSKQIREEVALAELSIKDAIDILHDSPKLTKTLKQEAVDNLQVVIKRLGTVTSLVREANGR